ncbi:MAG: enoyl-CoA hydratase/isomerase family protein [Agromyces sp.]
MNQFVQLSIADAIATVTIDRPEALNALSVEILTELAETFEHLEVQILADRQSVRGVILTGAGGRAFVAGADIRAMSVMDVTEGERIGQLGQTLTTRIEALPVPVIAAVDGVALGGGCELAMACDVIYATEASRFGQPEVKLGLIPGFGGSVRLPRFVGLARARELIYSGRVIDAATAHHYGLVAELFASRDELITAATDSLRLMAANGPLAIAATKAVMADIVGMDTESALARELAGFAECFAGSEVREGTTAFLEKRPAQF